MNRTLEYAQKLLENVMLRAMNVALAAKIVQWWGRCSIVLNALEEEPIGQNN